MSIIEPSIFQSVQTNRNVNYFADIPKQVQDAILEGEQAVAERRCQTDEQVFQEIDEWLQNG